ncbi:MAG: hypothetical protein IT424_09600 [Pirellulales bacterium]|nr:hypothetical protein [Pirellulales bacterium]
MRSRRTVLAARFAAKMGRLLTHRRAHSCHRSVRTDFNGHSLNLQKGYHKMNVRVICSSLALALMLSVASTASASHFRGAAMVPSVNSSGLLTVTTTAFWRKGQAIFDEFNPFVSGASGILSEVTVIDSSDSRYDIQVTTQTYQLTGAGVHSITNTGCCRVATGGRGNWSEGSWTMDSAILWDGSSANTPIDFNFASVQSQVSRLGAYSDSLHATSPAGLTLTYNQALNLSINSQPTPSFSVNTTSGALSIPAGETPLITDNTTLSGQNVGADAAFSGNILASDGSFVEFDWMFDGVDSAVNNAPDVGNGSDSGIVGTLFNFLFPITDDTDTFPGGGLTFDLGFSAILGPVPAIAPIFNAATGAFSWDSAGSALGTYIFQVRGRDSGNLTDVGSFTVDLIRVRPPNGVVPEPMSILVHGGLAASGFLALAVSRRRAKAKP